MSLTLIFLSDGTPTLYPSHFLKHNKQTNIYYTGDAEVDMQLAGDVTDTIVQSPAFKLYGFCFNKYYLAAAVPLARQMMCAVGSNSTGSVGCVCLTLNNREGSVRRAVCDGIKLSRSVLVSCNVVSESSLNPVEEVQLVSQLCRAEVSNVRLHTPGGSTRCYRFDIYGDEGQVCSSFFARARLESVIVDPVTGSVKHIMGLEIL
ncbi:MAG: hypothetical protein ACTJLM_00170 [Ehrlichia sp.]